MTLKDELPHDPDAAHALIRQKLNEHTEAINHVREENIRQNEKLEAIDEKLDRVDKNTEGVVEVVHFSRKLCQLLKLIGKIICWAAGIAGALTGIIQFVNIYGGQ